jgi:sialidase-1
MKCGTQRTSAGRPARSQSRSRDCGWTWSPAERETGINAVLTPVKTGIAACPATEDGKSRTVYAAPGANNRSDMTVWLSEDDTATWPIHRRIDAGPAAYSELAADKTILLAYERGRDSPYERITLARFTLSWLTGDGQ